MRPNKLLPILLLLLSLSAAPAFQQQPKPKEQPQVTVYMTRTGARYHLSTKHGRGACRDSKQRRYRLMF